MAKTRVTKTFTVYGKGTFDASISIPAESLEEALTNARNLCVTDFIEFKDSHNDSNLKIYGVYESESES